MNEAMAALLQKWDISKDNHKKFKQLIGYKDEKQLFVSKNQNNLIGSARNQRLNA